MIYFASGQIYFPYSAFGIGRLVLPSIIMYATFKLVRSNEYLVPGSSSFASNFSERLIKSYK